MCFFCSKKREMIVKRLNPDKPFVIINFKTYKEGSGDNALKLAKICERVQHFTGINIIVCPQAMDLKDVSFGVRIPVYAQHIDAKPLGKSTGNIIPENLADINIHGSLLNHSEHRLEYQQVEEAVLKLKELGMKSVVCAKNNVEAKKFSSMKTVKPDFIAVEPPELIGGEVSVSMAKPDIIEKSVKACTGVNVLVGAGIKDNNDMLTALKYGAKGVLLSSHCVLAADPEKFLMELLKGI